MALPLTVRCASLLGSILGGRETVQLGSLLWPGADPTERADPQAPAARLLDQMFDAAAAG